MDFDPTELIRTLGSLASISSAYLNVKKAIIDSGMSKRTAEGKLDGTLTPEQKQAILKVPTFNSAPRPTDTSTLQFISAEILESTTYRIRAARDRLVSVIRDGQISAIEDEQAIARSEICFFLSIVLEHNNGRFPETGNLVRLWHEFRCTPLYPKFAIRST